MKTVDEIFGEMMALFTQRTGLDGESSCDLAARLYAVAAQVYGLYVQADWVKRQCFPQTAQEEYLDYHAQLRGLERKGAVRAVGTARFTAAEAIGSPRTIPAGTVCLTAGLRRFETVQAGVLGAGELWADVPVRAVEPGAVGNIATGRLVSMAVAPVGIRSCTNPAPFSGGSDREGDEQLRERVLASYRRLPNGANAGFYQQGAMSFDQVAAARVLPRSRGAGTVDVVVATREGKPGEELLAQLKDYFQQRREIAVDVQVRAPALFYVNVTAKVAPQAGWELQTVLDNVRAAVRGWYTGQRLGEPILRAELGQLIYNCAGVANYALNTPAEDVKLRADQLPVLGTLTVEAMV